jgi:hypothetical protein
VRGVAAPHQLLFLLWNYVITLTPIKYLFESREAASKERMIARNRGSFDVRANFDTPTYLVLPVLFNCSRERSGSSARPPAVIEQLAGERANETRPQKEASSLASGALVACASHFNHRDPSNKDHQRTSIRPSAINCDIRETGISIDSIK